MRHHVLILKWADQSRPVIPRQFRRTFLKHDFGSGKRHHTWSGASGFLAAKDRPGVCDAGAAGSGLWALGGVYLQRALGDSLVGILSRADPLGRAVPVLATRSPARAPNPLFVDQ